MSATTADNGLIAVFNRFGEVVAGTVLRDSLAAKRHVWQLAERQTGPDDLLMLAPAHSTPNVDCVRAALAAIRLDLVPCEIDTPMGTKVEHDAVLLDDEVAVRFDPEDGEPPVEFRGLVERDGWPDVSLPVLGIRTLVVRSAYGCRAVYSIHEG